MLTIVILCWFVSTVRSSSAVPLPSGVCPPLENGTNYNGNDLMVNGTTKGVPCESLEKCCALCDEYSPCMYFTYRGNMKMCHLKFSDSGRQPGDPTCSSGKAHRSPYNGTSPNFVFLICESTDGRRYNQGSPAYIPTLRKLQKRGAYFTSFYSNSPVCAPSRSSLWSGRHVHRIPHINEGVKVNGAWNNAEGNPKNYSMLIHQVLSNNKQQNYTIGPAFGKTDWTVGGHALWNWLQCWTMYVQFPYNITDGGWNEQPGSACWNEGKVGQGNRSHQGDWDVVKKNTDWIKKEGPTLSQPFFVYQGMNIVHPAYNTVEYWYNKISADLPVPDWPPLSDIHPCDLQSSMLKGCDPTVKNTEVFYNKTRRQRIRRIYLAMIAEFDAMVAEYVDAVDKANLTDRTVFIITSDHGDMDMEHQQFYKMVPYDASARVPLVIAGPGVKHGEHNQPTSLLDIYPTILAFAGVDIPVGHSGLDGYSLLPLLSEGPNTIDTTRPDWIMSQGHMADNAISWFLLRQGDYKYIAYGTGKENEPQLFNIKLDPSEQTNLAMKPQYKSKVQAMDQVLQSAISYGDVSNDVADYSKKMFMEWYMKKYDWRTTLPKTLPGAWSYDLKGSLAAVQNWLDKPAQVLPCRNYTWKSPNIN